MSLYKRLMLPTCAVFKLRVFSLLGEETRFRKVQWSATDWTPDYRVRTGKEGHCGMFGFLYRKLCP